MLPLLLFDRDAGFLANDLLLLYFTGKPAKTGEKI